MSTKSSSSTGHRAGAASRLAGRVLVWTQEGLERRARGRCGTPLGAERRHRTGGHDAGCAALGLPRHELVRMIEQADTTGVGPLISDAIDQAIEDLAHRGAAWSIEAAREVICEAIERRITPAPASVPGAQANVVRAKFTAHSEGPPPSRMMAAAPRPRHG